MDWEKYILKKGNINNIFDKGILWITKGFFRDKMGVSVGFQEIPERL